MSADPCFAQERDDSRRPDLLGRQSYKEVDIYKKVPAGTHLVNAYFQGEMVELNPNNAQNIHDYTVSETARFIMGHPEGVTLIIPLKGGLMLADDVVRWLTESGYDLSRLDFRFVDKFEDSEGTTHYVMDGEEFPLNDTRVMIDDIVDKVGEYCAVRNILRERSKNDSLVCFTPVVKAEGVDAKGKVVLSTVDQAKGKGIAIQDLEDVKVGRFADINYAAVLPNEWIDCGFGMNSGHAEELSKLVAEARIEPRNRKEARIQKDAEARLKSLVKSYWGIDSQLHDNLSEILGEIQALERFSPFCLAGKPVDYAKYGKFLKANFKVHQSRHNEAFNVMLDMESMHFMRTYMRGQREVNLMISVARKYFQGLKKEAQENY